MQWGCMRQMSRRPQASVLDCSDGTCRCKLQKGQAGCHKTTLTMVQLMPHASLHTIPNDVFSQKQSNKSFTCKCREVPDCNMASVKAYKPAAWHAQRWTLSFFCCEKKQLCSRSTYQLCCWRPTQILTQTLCLRSHRCSSSWAEGAQGEPGTSCRGRLPHAAGVPGLGWRCPW